MKPIPNRRNRAALGAAVVAASLLAAAAAMAQTYETTSVVNLREGPGMDYAVLRALEQGERVEKIGSSGGYLQVKTSKDEQGYVWGTYLKVVTERGARVPGFEEFSAGMDEGGQGQWVRGPGVYYFERILEFLRIENHPVFVILLPLFVAIALGVGGGYLLRQLLPYLERVIPAALRGRRRQAAKIIFLAAGAFIVAEPLLYFVDLSLHYAVLEKDTALVLVLAVPRLFLAGPVALIEALARNWVVALVAVLLLAMVLWPGLWSMARADQSDLDGREQEADTKPSLSRPGSGSEPPEAETD